MLKRWFPVVSAAAVALLLTSAGSGRAQFLGAFGSGAMSPWSGTGNWFYAPNGMGFNYYRPGIYGGGYGGGMMGTGYGMMGMGGGMYPAYGGGYGMPSSVALMPMSYVAFYPPVYTTRAPVAAPPWPLLPAAQPATVTVIAPADAVVLFDGQQTSQTGAHRVFTTPALVKGQSYHYMVEARFMQNGKSVLQTRRVQVYSGGETTVTFPVAK
jgi:uncharacterized protein (TIGR03000 family)